MESSNEMPFKPPLTRQICGEQTGEQIKEMIIAQQLARKAEAEAAEAEEMPPKPPRMTRQTCDEMFAAEMKTSIRNMMTSPLWGDPAGILDKN